MSQYAYSLNGENWVGAFDAREAALAAAIQKCSGAIDPPGTVFVAEIAAGEAFADRLGKGLIQEMRTRAKSRGAEGASRYLQTVTRAEMDELDAAVEKAVVTWLQKNNLMPQSFKVAGISEHAVPMPHRAISHAGE